MTTVLLSLLLGCFNQPVAVVVEYSSGPDPYNCGVETGVLEKTLDGMNKDLVAEGIQKGEECCTKNGGELVGWKLLETNYEPGGIRAFTLSHPVCLYR